MAVFPTEVRRLVTEGRGTGLTISWSDGTSTDISSKTIRAECPCATCNERRGIAHDTPIAPAGRSRLRVVTSTVDEETNLVQVWSVGSYAIGIRWGDGHDSGIFGFDLLRELSSGRVIDAPAKEHP